MKQIAFAKVLSVVISVLMLCVFVPTPTIANQVQYIYDDLGCLSHVIDGQGKVVTYQYDVVGNQLSVTGNAAAAVNISITGTNLTGAALATDNPGILVRNVLTTPTSLTATFQIAVA